MPRRASPTDTTPPAGACPHVDRNDPRCGGRFSLGRLDQAFTVCFGCYRGCPMYHRINREQHASQEQTEPATRFNQVEPQPSAPLIALTAHGREMPLRPTGS